LLQRPRHLPAEHHPAVLEGRRGRQHPGSRPHRPSLGAPFSERWSHPFWRATLEHFGIASRWVRPPQPSYTDQQMPYVESFYDELGLKPERLRLHHENTKG